MEVGVVGHGAVDAVEERWVDVLIACGRGVAGEVGRGAHDGFAEGAEELLAEVHVGDADSHGAVVCGEVLGQGGEDHVLGQYDGGGTLAAEQEVGGFGGQEG